MFHSKLLNRLSAGASLTAIAILGSSPALAQEAPQANEQEGGLDVIVVTATKRSENLQDVPVAVQAIGEAQLDELNVQTFADYLTQLPNVTAGGAGPGQSTIYIRGLASTTPNLTTSGVAGLAPNVALYLDEQPVSQPGRNLDVYAADLERVEVLSGPQGTLFGASSQAGTVRLITNKPSLSGFDAKVSAGLGFTKGGEASWNFEAMVNIPIAETFALRAVGYVDDQGGYIDNVAGTRTVEESGRFRPAGTVRSNGVPVSPGRGGFQAGADLSAVTFLEANNSALVEDDFNDTRYTGFRVSALWEITPDWKLTVAHARQKIDSDGVFIADPTLDLDDLAIQRYEEDSLDDRFSNTSWTLEGRLGALDIVYTGAYTDRETSQRVDYSDYLFVGQYIPYYICDGSVSYPGGAPTGTCQAPNLFVTADNNTTVFTQELRFSTPNDYWLRATAGGFYSDLKLDERVDFTYPGSENIDLFGGSFPPNFSQAGVFSSDDTAYPAGVIFRNDIRRTDKQWGLFGEVTAEVVPDKLEFVFGARYYDVEVDFEGSANSSFCNSSGVDENAFGTNISDLYDGDGSFTFIGSCNDALRQTFTLDQSIADIQAAGLSAGQAQQVFNALRAPDTASTNGFIFKGTINYTPVDDVLLYATYSEGFRPGLLNRPGGATNGAGFTVPFVLETDTVKNYEFGWKTKGFDNQLRFNGNFFYVDISNLQTTIFDPAITNLFFSDNAADAEILGIEADLSFAPNAVPGLTVSGAFSALSTEITEVLTPTTDVIEGAGLAFAPSFQGNLRARYEFPVSSKWTAHIQPQVTYSASTFTDIIEINKLQLDSWTTFDLSAGITGDNWMFEIFGKNLTDERAQLSGNFVNDRARISVNRPLTVGARVSWTY